MKGVTCAHCLRGEECPEGWREMTCRDFRPDWDAIEADPSTRRQGRAEKKRIRRAAREQIARLNEETNK